MLVYTYSHYSHKLFFSYKKRKVETLSPLTKEEGKKGRRNVSFSPPYKCNPTLPFTRIIFVDPSAFALNQLQNTDKPRTIFIKNGMQGGSSLPDTEHPATLDPHQISRMSIQIKYRGRNVDSTNQKSYLFISKTVTVHGDGHLRRNAF